MDATFDSAAPIHATEDPSTPLRCGRDEGCAKSPEVAAR